MLRGGKPLQCSNDHTAWYEPEQARIKALGGQIIADSKGVLRVDGKLQVTRSLGDRQVG
jgi:hypothetical protein